MFFSETSVIIYSRQVIKFQKTANLNSKILQISKFHWDKAQNKMDTYFSFKYVITSKKSRLIKEQKLYIIRRFQKYQMRKKYLPIPPPLSNMIQKWLCT